VVEKEEDGLIRARPLDLRPERRRESLRLVKKAIDAGGQPAMDPMDQGFLYGWSFYDPDGHHWEVLWMDPKVAQS
jgi:predicted lactoylglutathione lyase